VVVHAHARASASTHAQTQRHTHTLQLLDLVRLLVLLTRHVPPHVHVACQRVKRTSQTHEWLQLSNAINATASSSHAIDARASGVCARMRSDRTSRRRWRGRGCSLCLWGLSLGCAEVERWGGEGEGAVVLGEKTRRIVGVGDGVFALGSKMQTLPPPPPPPPPPAVCCPPAMRTLGDVLFHVNTTKGFYLK